MHKGEYLQIIFSLVIREQRRFYEPARNATNWPEDHHYMS